LVRIYVIIIYLGKSRKDKPKLDKQTVLLIMLNSFNAPDSTSSAVVGGQQVVPSQTDEFADDLLRKREYPLFEDDDDERDSKVFHCS
jgi:hypothetical protein